MNSLLVRSAMLIVFCIAATPDAYSQNLPVLDDIPDTYLFNGSGTNLVFLPGIGDGDNNDQALTISAVSSDESIVTVGNSSFTDGDRTATLELTAAGTDGASTGCQTVPGKVHRPTRLTLFNLPISQF